MDIVEIEIGFDRFEAQVIADHCLDEGVKGELLLFDESRYEMGTAARIPNRFIVQSQDEPVVRRVIADLYPNMVFHSQPDIMHASTSPVRNQLIVIAVALLILGPLLFGLIFFLG